MNYYLLSAIAIVAFILGYFIKSYNITFKRVAGFLYRKVKGTQKTYGPWSIGIYVGSSPLELVEPTNIENPVITGSDITDFDASFVADPFIIKKDETYFLFFEALRRETEKGVISYATSEDGFNWQYQKTVLEEPFHLSYPYIFEWQGNFYMVPESYQDYSVRLYRAKAFPEKWEHISTLLSGFDFVDPTLFHHNGMWWMFVSTSNSSFLNLYYSEHLEKGWSPHPQNPIVRDNRHISRPGGRVLNYNNKLFRFAQDTYPVYGSRLLAFEIEKLSIMEYIEKPAINNPILGREKDKKEWNKKGMHQIDAIKLNNGWIAAVDGRWT